MRIPSRHISSIQLIYTYIYKLLDINCTHILYTLSTSRMPPLK
jgi:hypothetical protein